MIILVRADDRLIHGMVAVSWTSAIKPETILVANDEAAGDSFKAATMKLAKPAGVKLIIKTCDDSIKALNNPINDRKKIFLVTETVEDACYIWGTRQGDRQAQHRHGRRQQAGRGLHSDAAAGLHDAERI